MSLTIAIMSVSYMKGQAAAKKERTKSLETLKKNKLISKLVPIATEHLLEELVSTYYSKKDQAKKSPDSLPELANLAVSGRGLSKDEVTLMREYFQDYYYDFLTFKPIEEGAHVLCVSNRIETAYNLCFNHAKKALAETKKR